MEKQAPYQFPVLTIDKVEPLLQKGPRIFAQTVTARLGDKEVFKIYENKGLDLEPYTGREVECLLEITKGAFLLHGQSGGTAQKAMSFRYQWEKRPFEFFPELVKMREDLTDANVRDEEPRLKAFETFATELFSSWGINGLNIGIYQAKPVLKSVHGVFFLNEFEFEEDIEDLELDQEVHLEIEEIYLRGIRPIK